MTAKPSRILEPSGICRVVVYCVLGFFFMGLFFGCGTAVKERSLALEQPAPATSRSDAASVLPAETADDGVAAVSNSLVEPQTTKNPGSLWESNSAFGSLFISQKAHHIGDIVTIRIVESSSASNKANTSTGRNSSLSIETPKFFGAESEVPQEWLFNPLGQLSAGFGSAFDGEGSTNRSGDLTAYITAKVTEVYPNGNLQILGTREVAINDEKQFIHLSGVIRSRDISTDNVILSTYIADAKIEYSGKGIIDDRQKPGWLTTLFNKLWPF